MTCENCTRLEVQAAVMRKALEAYDPPMPPALEGESDEEYTDRVTGADKTGRVPYTERRNRQCSIGYHEECSDQGVEAQERVCHCPCHQFEELRERALCADAGKELLAKLGQVEQLNKDASVAHSLLAEKIEEERTKRVDAQAQAAAMREALRAHEEFAACDTGPFLPTAALLAWLAKWANEGETANVTLARLRREALCSPE